MRRTAVLLTCGIATIAIACSRGSGSGIGLHSGTYLASNSAVAPDQCHQAAFWVANGDAIDVIVHGSALHVAGASVNADLVRSGATYAAPPLVMTLDFTSTATSGLVHAYGCVEKDVFSDSASGTGTDRFHFIEDVMYLVSSGLPAECSAAESSTLSATFTIPCHSISTFDASR